MLSLTASFEMNQMKMLSPYVLVVLIGVALIVAVPFWEKSPERSSQVQDVIHSSDNFMETFKSIRQIPGCHVQYLRSRNTYTVTVMGHDSIQEITSVIKRVVDTTRDLPQFFLYVSTNRFSDQCLELLAECGPNLKGLYVGPNAKVSNDLLVSFCDSRQCQLLTKTIWGIDVSQ